MQDNDKKIDDLDQQIKAAAEKSGIKLAAEEEIARDPKQVVQTSASAGMEFAAAIIIATFAGIWLDKQFNTAPIFMLILLVLGSCTAFYNLYRASENMGASEKLDDPGLPDE